MAGRMRGLLERLLARRREAAGDGVPDSELLRRFTRDRDEAAFELLVWRHGGMVLSVCRRAIRDEQLAEDAFQAVFLVLARKAGAVRGNLGGWLFKIARRVAARALKKHSFVQPVVEIAAAPVVDPAERAEVTRVLDAEVARLPERLRRPVVLCYLGGWSTEDAAREIGCPRGTVLSRLATARKHLADRLVRQGVTLPAALVTVGLSGQLVSSATTSASRFLSGSFPVSTATQLANGVIQTMSRATLLGMTGGLLCAATLATSVGWVAAQPERNGTNQEPPNAVAPKAIADPPGNPPTPAPPDPIAARAAADMQFRKFEQYADALKAEIEAHEKHVELMTRANGTGIREQVRLEKQLADIDEEAVRQTREIFKLEAELTVLEKSLDDKTAPEPHGDILRSEIDRDERVEQADRALQDAKLKLAAVRERTVPKEAPLVLELAEKVAKAKEAHADAMKGAKEQAISNIREREKHTTRQRIAKIRMDLEIQKIIREKTTSERQIVLRLISATLAEDRPLAELRSTIQLQRENLTSVQRYLLIIKAERHGITLTESNSPETKLDAILRELIALRKEVREMKEQNKK